MTNRKRPMILVLLCRTLAATAALAAGTAFAQELNPARRHPDAAADVGDSQQILVRFKSAAADKGRAQALSATTSTDQVASLAARSGMIVRQARHLTSSLQVLEVEPLAAGETLAARLERLRADPSVEYAEPDLRRYPHALPNDPLYTGQWYLQARADAPAAVDAEHAWDTTKGRTGVVIAVLDTGVLYNHPDLRRAAACCRVTTSWRRRRRRTTATGATRTPPIPATGLRRPKRIPPRSPVATSAVARGTVRARPASSRRAPTTRKVSRA